MRAMRYLVILWAAAAVVLSAAAPWDEKPYTQWSDKDVDKLVSDSPWAGRASLTHEREGANLGPVPDWKLVISMQSALPIRQALLRRELGPGVAASAEQESRLATESPRYVFAISRIPGIYQRQLTKAAQAALLKVKGKAPISATDASVFLFDKEGKPATLPPPARPQASAGAQIVPVSQGGGGFGAFGGGPPQDNSGITATLILEFPRTTPITASDGEFELWTVIGGYAVKKNFKVKDMTFKGAFAS